MPELLSQDEIDGIRKQIEDGVARGGDGGYEKAIARTILEAGVLRLGDYSFASGYSNNKLEMERLFELVNSVPRTAVLAGLGRMALRFKPDGLYGIPPNGDRFAQALGEVLELPVIGLERVCLDNGRRTYNLATIGGQECLPAHFDRFRRLVAIKDVSATYGSVEECLRPAYLARQTAAALVIWGRGDTPPFESSVWDTGVSLQTLVHWPIGRHLTPNDELHAYAPQASEDLITR